MNPSVLLQKLIEIERSIGVETESSTRRKVLEAQEYILQQHWGREYGGHDDTSQNGQSAKFFMLRNLAKAK